MNERDIHTRINNLVLRAYVTKNLSSDDESIDRVEISYLGKKGINVEKVSPYGLCSAVPEDTQCLKINIAGKESNIIIIPYETTERIKGLQEGEVVVWNPKTESYIKFDKDGNIEIDAKAAINITVTGDVNLKASNVKINATQVDLGVSGKKIARLGDSVQVDTGTGQGTITSAGNNTSI